MDANNELIENKAYRRDRAGLVLFSLIVMVYNYGGGYISQDSGSIGTGLSLIIGVRFENTKFIELIVVLSMLYFMVKFIVSSKKIRTAIYNCIYGEVTERIKGPHEIFRNVSLKWYGVLLTVTGKDDDGNYCDLYSIRIHPLSKHYLLSKKIEFDFAITSSEYVDYYFPWLLLLTASASIYGGLTT